MNQAEVRPAMREAIIGFVTEAIADRGVGAVHLKHILGFCPRSRFYACFACRDDCINATLEAATDELLETVRAEGIDGLLRRAAERPAVARVVFVEGRSINLELTERFVSQLCREVASPVTVGDELRVGALLHLLGAASRRGTLGTLATDQKSASWR